MADHKRKYDLIKLRYEIDAELSDIKRYRHHSDERDLREYEHRERDREYEHRERDREYEHRERDRDCERYSDHYYIRDRRSDSEYCDIKNKDRYSDRYDVIIPKERQSVPNTPFIPFKQNTQSTYFSDTFILNDLKTVTIPCLLLLHVNGLTKIIRQKNISSTIKDYQNTDYCLTAIYSEFDVFGTINKKIYLLLDNIMKKYSSKMHIYYAYFDEKNNRWIPSVRYFTSIFQ